MKTFLTLFIISIFMATPLMLFAEENTDFSYGAVIEIKEDSGQIVVSEYDWDNDEEMEVVYMVDPSVEMENIDSWLDLPKGSYIDIEFITEEQGNKVIKSIYLYEEE